MDLTTILISSLPFESMGELAASALKELVQRALSARQDYRAREAAEGLDHQSPVEVMRQSLIADINRLQNELTMSGAAPQFVGKAVLVLFEQVALVYEAKTEQELSIVRMNLGQVRGYLDRYRRIMRGRAWARWLAIIVTVIALIGVGVLIYVSWAFEAYAGDTVLPVLRIPVSVLLWAAIGSFTAILYRFNCSGDIELRDPLRWLFTRPLTGVVIGAVTYFVVRIGFLATGFEDSESIRSPELFWLIAFLSGFSDRFADRLLRSLVGRFGGKAEDSLLNLGEPTTLERLSSLKALVEDSPILKPFKGRQQETIESSESVVDENGYARAQRLADSQDSPNSDEESAKEVSKQNTSGN